MSASSQTRDDRPDVVPERIFSLGSMRVIERGNAFVPHGDFYYLLFTLSWWRLFGLLTVGYVLLNIVFAGIYVLGGDCIANAQPGSFRDAFFFSVQTMATIGYGAMYPTTAYSNFWVVVEVFVGLLAVAMATGLMFARFSRPHARVLFSNVAVICPFNGVPTLMFRAANQRSNLVLEAQVNVTILLPEVTPEGHSLRRLYDLKLVRSQTPTFALSWMMMHPITPDSPLYGLTATDLYEQDARIIITLMGLDETVSQTVHSRHTYEARQILWNMKFVDVLEVLPGGDRVIDYRDFHTVVGLDDYVL
ncbi:MAG: ATP-sensitive inward rectifier potassium channel 10 [Spirulina sp. SIO3F2]|nr:ATP-sensitive inward rectifier potassium channel 10 [Spirulina sp. SIO3F2]